MSKTKGKLFYRSNEKELSERSDWDELSHDERKQLGKLGWFETESLYPPDRYWKGEIENGVPHGQGTFYTPDKFNKNIEFYNGSKFEGTYENGERKEGTFTWSRGNKYIGTYKNNKRWNGEMIYVDGNKDSKYVNGEVSDKITDADDLEILAKLQSSESILGSRILRNDEEPDVIIKNEYSDTSRK